MDDPKDTIFTVENQTLARAQAVLDEKSVDEAHMLHEFQTLFQQYKRLYNQLRRLIKISDRQQSQLRGAYETIAQQKAQLEEQNKELREAATLREDVARIARHDLKSPLNAILGYASFLLKTRHEMMPEQIIDYLCLVERAGRKMLYMINHSLDLFKMERGLYTLHPIPLNIIVLLQQVVAELGSLAEQKGILTTILVANEPVSKDRSLLISGEEHVSYCILSNLIKNAIEASPPQGEIMISLNEEEMEIVIRIVNPGSVPVLIRDRFFEKYITAGKTHGTGLGTYSAKLFTRIQHGSISMHITPEDETCIAIRLPKGHRPEAQNAPQHAQQQAKPMTNEDMSSFLRMFAALPAELIEKMKSAIFALDMPLIRECITQIYQYDAALADWIALQTQGFRFDRLQAFFEDTTNSAPNNDLFRSKEKTDD